MSKIGIIGAMESEVKTLQAGMKDPRIVTQAGMEFHEGILGGANVVVVRSGMGKVNAALCVQILVDLFEVTHIINTGIAGSLNPKLNIGDILISRDAIHHDVDVRALGAPLGEIPLLGTREFRADEEMVRLARETVAEVLPETGCLVGRIVSGDQFISDREKKEFLIREFQGDCAEMEGASIAHGAYLNGRPFVILRAISDKADGSAETDFSAFEKAAAEHCAKLVAAFVTKL